MECSASVVVVGDINLSHYLRGHTRAGGAPWAFEPCLDHLRADVLFGNLECLLFKPGWADEPPLHRDRLHLAWPEALGLPQAGFDVVTLANNHILDFGARIAAETVEFLKTHGIAHVGFGADPVQARRPAVLERNGLRIGFLAYVEDVPDLARRVDPGPAYIHEPNIVADIRALRRAGAHVVVVSLHADMEFADHPAPHRVAMSRRLIDAGADVVLGHHPHVPQGIERHGRGLIAYSLGNFVFPVADDPYLEHNSPWTDKSFVLRMQVSRAGCESHEIVPVRIEPRGRPVPMTGADEAAFRARHERLSAALADPAALEQAWLATGRRWLRINIDWLVAEAKQHGVEAAARNFLMQMFYDENAPWLRPVLRELLAGLPPRLWESPPRRIGPNGPRFLARLNDASPPGELAGDPAYGAGSAAGS